MIRPFSDIYIDGLVNEAVGEIDNELSVHVQKQVTHDVQDVDETTDQTVELKSKRKKKKSCKRKIRKSFIEEPEIVQDYLREDVLTLDSSDFSNEKDKEIDPIFSSKAVKSLHYFHIFNSPFYMYFTA